MYVTVPRKTLSEWDFLVTYLLGSVMWSRLPGPGLRDLKYHGQDRLNIQNIARLNFYLENSDRVTGD